MKSANSLRSLLGILMLLMATVGGCNSPAPPADGQSPAPTTTPTGNATGSTSTAADPAGDDQPTNSGIKIVRLGGAGSRARPADDQTTLDESLAIERLSEQFAELGKLDRVVVAWLFDTAQSSETLTRATASAIATRLAAQGDSAKQVEHLIATFSDSVQWKVESPTSDSTTLTTALEGLTFVSEGERRPQAAVDEALDQLQKTAERATRIVVLVTDTAGDDWDQVDPVADRSRRESVPIFVIGYPAPFGTRTLTVAATAGTPPLRGPETPDAEFIAFQFTGQGLGPIALDSGFGPWSLERLCRAGGGSFLAIRPKPARFASATSYDGNWPSDQAPRFDPAIMSRYAPAYTPLETYRARRDGNRALAALAKVAVGRTLVRTLQNPVLQFDARDEAQLRRDLDLAQQPAALLSSTINQVQEALKQGEADRATLTEPRWQAAYDLAMGQALAAVVRIDGYNGMLAQLKTGKSFKDPKSDLWILEPGDSIDTSSLMRTKLEDAKKYLQRVIDDHPGTPWAYLAEEELKTPIGWVWREVDTDR